MTKLFSEMLKDFPLICYSETIVFNCRHLFLLKSLLISHSALNQKILFLLILVFFFRLLFILSNPILLSDISCYTTPISKNYLGIQF